MSEEIIARYPKPYQERDMSDRPYRVDYELAYDGGGSRWSGHYRTLWGARFSIWWNMHISSYGGSAALVRK